MKKYCKLDDCAEEIAITDLICAGCVSRHYPNIRQYLMNDSGTFELVEDEYLPIANPKHINHDKKSQEDCCYTVLQNALCETQCALCFPKSRCRAHICELHTC
jgi:hypothetical protein